MICLALCAPFIACALEEAGGEPEELGNDSPRVAEVPFDDKGTCGCGLSSPDFDNCEPGFVAESCRSSECGDASDCAECSPENTGKYCGCWIQCPSHDIEWWVAGDDIGEDGCAPPDDGAEDCTYTKYHDKADDDECHAGFNPITCTYDAKPVGGQPL